LLIALVRNSPDEDIGAANCDPYRYARYIAVRSSPDRMRKQFGFYSIVLERQPDLRVSKRILSV